MMKALIATGLLTVLTGCPTPTEIEAEATDELSQICVRRRVDGLPCLVCSRTDYTHAGYPVTSITIDCDWHAETSIHLPE